MDNPHVYIERNRNSQRPRWLTLCMMASVASVLVLAGCGDNEELPDEPAEEAAPMEQDQNAANGQTSGLEQEPTMEQDPGLEEDSGSAGSMTQSTGAESEEPMAEQETMPENTMDEPAEGTMNPDEDEPGFGDGTDPMPGDEESNGENGEDESGDESTSS